MSVQNMGGSQLLTNIEYEAPERVVLNSSNVDIGRGQLLDWEVLGRNEWNGRMGVGTDCCH